MGLDVDYGAWHGAYSAFARFREKIAQVINIPLNEMEGFCRSEAGQYMESENKDKPPFPWNRYKDDPIIFLLDHSDCDGEIERQHLLPLADRLDEIRTLTNDEDLGGHCGQFHKCLLDFAQGCRGAYKNNDNLNFG